MTAKKGPYMLDETPGTKYYCACGLSDNAPYCDGSHEGTALKPFKVDIAEKKKVAVCGCGRSSNLPFCDGTHKSL